MDYKDEIAVNIARMVLGWSWTQETLDALLEEIRDELLRGLGATIDPPEITPELRTQIDEFLRDLFGGK